MRKPQTLNEWSDYFRKRELKELELSPAMKSKVQKWLDEQEAKRKRI